MNTVLHSNGTWGKVTYADMDEEAVAKIQACPFPTGSVYISVDGKNPATYWPGTTWVAFAMGRCLIGAGAADSGTLYKAGDKLGEEKHANTLAEIPIHNHAGRTGDAGGHNHDRGNMNITGAFWGRDVQSGYNGNGAFSSVAEATGMMKAAVIIMIIHRSCLLKRPGPGLAELR